MCCYWAAITTTITTNKRLKKAGARSYYQRIASLLVSCVSSNGECGWNEVIIINELDMLLCVCIWYLFVFFVIIFGYYFVWFLFHPYLNNIISIMCGFCIKTLHDDDKLWRRKMFVNIKYVIPFFPLVMHAVQSYLISSSLFLTHVKIF